MDDKEIVRLFWDRREEGIQEADNKYHRLCYGIAKNILDSHEDSEECVYDTWFSAWNYIPPQIPRFLSAFFSKITRGLAIDALRRRTAARRIPSHVCEAIDETKNLSVIVRDFSDKVVDAQNLLNIIEAFLDNLTQKDRDIFLQRYWYLSPNKEIAKRHHISENTVKQNLLRSRKKLQAILKQEGYE